MQVALLGGTGVLGRNVAPRLLAAGHRVRALVRAPSPMFEAWGVECVVGDLFDPLAHARLFAGCDAALHLATALKPSATGAPDWALNDRIRRESVRLMLEACVAYGVKRVVQQSVAFVATGPETTDGTGPLAHLPFLTSAMDMEAMVDAAPLSSLIVRGGALYGPGTGLTAEISRAVVAGRLTLPGEGGDWVSLIHVADLSAAMVAAIPSTATGLIAVVDDHPTTWRTWFEELSTTLGHAPPRSGGVPRLPSFRVDNGRARSLLSWRPFFADYRHAFEEWSAALRGR